MDRLAVARLVADQAPALVTRDRYGFGPMATPQGNDPTGMVRSTVMVAVFTTLTLLAGPLAVYSLLASLVSAIPHGRVPTSTVTVRESVAGSIAETVLPRPFEM